MSKAVIKVENLSKHYRLGMIGGKTLREDIQRWWAGFRGKPNPLLKIGQSDRENVEDECLWALKDISFEVKEGEVLGIIGRNGAGKSTLLKIISRITAPTAGEIRIKGRVGCLLEVGAGFHPELTGRENVYLNGAILGMTKREVDGKFDEIVEFAAVGRFIDTPVKRYSSGMHVRLAFAVAAHLQPDILVVDEVLAVGDIAFQKKCLGKMGDITKQGRTVLFVSHGMAAIRSLCSRVLLLKDGSIAELGPTDYVVTKYLLDESASKLTTVPLPKGCEDTIGQGTRLSFSAEDGTPKSQFLIGEIWKIVLEFQIFTNVPHVIAAIGLVTFDSISIATYWSKPSNLRPGQYKVEFNIDVPLKSCELECVVGLSTYERAFYYREHVGHISISEVALNGQPFRASGAGIFLTSQCANILHVE